MHWLGTLEGTQAFEEPESLALVVTSSSPGGNVKGSTARAFERAGCCIDNFISGSKDAW